MEDLAGDLALSSSDELAGQGDADIACSSDDNVEQVVASAKRRGHGRIKARAAAVVGAFLVVNSSLKNEFDSIMDFWSRLTELDVRLVPPCCGIIGLVLVRYMYHRLDDFCHGGGLS